MSHSLRRHLIHALVWPTLVAVFGGVMAYRTAVDVVGSAYDASLLNLAEGAANSVHVTDGRLVVDLSGEAEALLRTDRTDQIFFRVRSDAGEWVAGDRGLPPPEPPGAEREASYYEVVYAGVPVRGVRIHRQLGEVGFYVTVAESRIKRLRAVQRLVFGFGGAAIGVLAAAVLIVRFAIPSGLKPLRHLEQALEMRDSHDMTPIDPRDVPAEIRAVVRALNDLLARLDGAMGAQREFLQNAAHELRTPLASLQVQIDTLGDSPDSEALARLRRSVGRTTRLANQLLALARVESIDQLMATAETVALAPIIDDMVEDWVRRADEKGIDLGIEREPVSLFGEPTLLRELVANLMDNAIKYTPEGGRVTLRCHARDGRIHLSVADNGPGIVPEWQVRVFERFARIPGTRGSGAGLGLAIVREIALAHGGRIWLETPAGGTGLVACVVLDRARSSGDSPS
jgi:two-component system sensor histidine kinase TctE